MNLNENSYQVVIFNIEDELYAIDILKVQEIVSYMEPFAIPNSPEYFKGMINLRGIIIPVIDLRIRLDFVNKIDSSQCVIVVVSIDDRKYGLIVDSVSDVITITKDFIQKNVDTHTGINSRYIEGIARHNDSMVILINIDKIFKKEELETLTNNFDS